MLADKTGTVVDGVTIAPGLLATLGDHVSAAAPNHRYVLITDDTVGALYAARATASFASRAIDVLTIPPGEALKTRDTWSMLTDRMLAAGVGRDTTVVALGGGVVGDLAGFVAATYMRGLPIVQVPTTLLAMIDASIGGKTGVDTPAGKNLVGAFHPPAAVFIDPAVLSSLSPRLIRAGLAEALKHGIIADAAYFTRTIDDLPLLLAPGEAGARSEAMTAVIARSIAIKSDVVRQDSREAGIRKILNFGHTVGHAAESLSRFALLHGEAVAIGMSVESRLAEQTGVAEPGTAARVREALVRAALPTAVPRDLASDALVALTHGDKKRRAGRVEYALPRTIGAMAAADSGWGVPIDDAAVLEALRTA